MDIADGGVRLHGVADPPARYRAGDALTSRDGLRFARRLLPAIEGRRFDIIDCAAMPRLPFYATWLGGWLAESPVVATWFEFDGNSDQPAAAKEWANACRTHGVPVRGGWPPPRGGDD
jgi:hypothetical protein